MTPRLVAAALLLPALFLVEVILGGPFGTYGGVSLRFLLLGASCGVLLFVLLLRGRVARAHLVPILSILGFLLVNGIWIAVVPIMTGTKFHWALREPHAFIVLLPVLLTLAALGPAQLRGLVPRLQRIVVVTSLVLAAFQVALWAVGTLLGDLQWVVPVVLDRLFPDADDHLKVGPGPDGFFRVFWISTLWCVLAFFWVPAAFRSTRAQWLCQGLLLMAIFVSYSRGIWIGLVAGQVVAYAARLQGRTRAASLLRPVAAGAVAVAAIVGLVAVTGQLERGAARVTSTTSRSDESIGARVEQADHLLRLWSRHPFVGSGYGAYVPGYIRSQETPYSYEHMPYALLGKVGLIGVLASGLFLAGWAWSTWRARRRMPVQAASLLAAGTALLIAEMTNPLLLHFVSMTITGCLLLQWAGLVSSDRLEPSPS